LRARELITLSRQKMVGAKDRVKKEDIKDLSVFVDA
jgi:hypothetical protein